MYNEPNFYVYEWVRPDSEVVFYVGKGKGNRLWSLSDRNNGTLKVVKELEKNGMRFNAVIIARFISEHNAFLFEKERIAYWSSAGELTNRHPGGQGMSGYKHTEETKLKLKEIAIKNSQNIEITLKKRNALCRQDVVARKSATMKIVVNTDSYKEKKAATEAKTETKEKRSKSQKIAQNKPETVAKHKTNNAGAGNPNAKAVIELSDLKVFTTIKEAENYYGAKNISAVCRGKLRSSGGRSFAYLSEYLKNNIDGGIS